MAICAPCRVPHGGEQCEDTQAGRCGVTRAWYCQHKTRPVNTAEPCPGPAGGNTRGERHGQGRDHPAHCGQRGEDTVISAAPSGPDHGYGEAFDDPADDPVDAGDLLDDPWTDVEALCLCSLLWSSSSVARTITDTLTPSDFERPVYRELFELIAAQIEAGTPHDPASIAAALTQTGRAAGHRGTQLSRALSDATMAGGAPEAAEHYAITVVSAAYRRGFHAAATSLTEAAEQLPQDQLFAHLLSIGRAQRTATQRLADISSVLGRPPIIGANGKTETDTVKEQP